MKVNLATLTTEVMTHLLERLPGIPKFGQTQFSQGLYKAIEEEIRRRANGEYGDGKHEVSGPMKAETITAFCAFYGPALLARNFELQGPTFIKSNLKHYPAALDAHRLATLYDPDHEKEMYELLSGSMAGVGEFSRAACEEIFALADDETRKKILEICRTVENSCGSNL